MIIAYEKQLGKRVIPTYFVFRVFIDGSFQNRAIYFIFVTTKKTRVILCRLPTEKFVTVTDFDF